MVSDSVALRPAGEADLARVGQIWAANQDLPSDPPIVPSLYAHELATRELVVAEDDGLVVGFAALIKRGQVSFLADLFVDPAHQSGGIGSQLLRHVMPGGRQLCCTMSSSDPRALSLYIRSGMRPHWPCFQLRGTLHSFQASNGELRVLEAEIGDPALIDWDRDIGGRSRPRDHAYWIEQRGGVPLWFVRRGERVGYGYAQTCSDDLPAAKQTLTLGPIGIREASDAATCVALAARWAIDRAPALRISVPAPHPALGPLLALGLRIHDIDTFCSTQVPRFADFRRYLPSGGDLF